MRGRRQAGEGAVRGKAAGTVMWGYVWGIPRVNTDAVDHWRRDDMRRYIREKKKYIYIFPAIRSFLFIYTLYFYSLFLLFTNSEMREIVSV